MSDKPRAITPDEGRNEFLTHIHCVASNAVNDPLLSPREAVNLAIFSILAAIDGVSAGLPAFDLVPSPHESDKDFHISEGQNYWVPEPINGMTMLHDEWSSEYELSKRPDGSLLTLLKQSIRRNVSLLSTEEAKELAEFVNKITGSQ